MKNLIINLFLKFLPSIIVDIFDKYESKLEELVKDNDYDIDDALLAALKKAIDALR